MSIAKRHGREYADDYEKLKTALYKLQYRYEDEILIPWMVPQCPKCGGVLSQVCGSKLLMCVKCDTEFDLTEYKMEVKT